MLNTDTGKWPSRWLFVTTTQRPWSHDPHLLRLSSAGKWAGQSLRRGTKHKAFSQLPTERGPLTGSRETEDKIEHVKELWLVLCIGRKLHLQALVCIVSEDHKKYFKKTPMPPQHTIACDYWGICLQCNLNPWPLPLLWKWPDLLGAHVQWVGIQYYKAHLGNTALLKASLWGNFAI